MKNKDRFNISNDFVKGKSINIPKMNNTYEVISSIKFFYRSFKNYEWG